MWWSSLTARPARHGGSLAALPLAALPLAAVSLAALPLAGCLQPMYGNFAAGGPGLQNELQAIAVEPIPERIGHYLGDDLVADLNGTGSHPIPRYRLFVTLNEAVQTPLIDTVSGRASSATVVVNAEYRLESFTTGLPVARGTAFVFKSYDRTSQRFADVRASRDAEIRDAKELSDLIRQRLAAALAERRIASPALPEANRTQAAAERAADGELVGGPK